MYRVGRFDFLRVRYIEGGLLDDSCERLTWRKRILSALIVKHEFPACRAATTPAVEPIQSV